MRSRSVLFGPAQRTDFVPKFVASGADIGVLDLEDATPEAGKAQARQTLIDEAPGRHDLGSMLFFVRVNALGTSHFAADIAAAAAAMASGIIAPKLETNREVDDVRREMGKAGLGDALLCAGIESVAGVYHAVEVAGAGVDLVYFGAEDFITDIGGVRTKNNTEVMYARSRVAMAARMASVPALDQVVVDYHDDARFTEEALMARSFGFQGKLCIHPSQVTLANSAFTPSADELAWARGVVEAAEVAEGEGSGVVSFNATMVDAPIVLRARQLLASFEH